MTALIIAIHLDNLFRLQNCITGINEVLIKRLNITLATITSGHRITIEKFKEYAYKTAEIYVQRSTKFLFMAVR